MTTVSSQKLVYVQKLQKSVETGQRKFMPIEAWVPSLLSDEQLGTDICMTIFDISVDGAQSEIRHASGEQQISTDQPFSEELEDCEIHAVTALIRIAPRVILLIASISRDEGSWRPDKNCVSATEAIGWLRKDPVDVVIMFVGNSHRIAVGTIIGHDIEILASASFQGSSGSIVLPERLGHLFYIGCSGIVGESSNDNLNTFGNESDTVLRRFGSDPSIGRILELSNDERLCALKKESPIVAVGATGVATVLSDYIESTQALDDDLKPTYELIQQLVIKLSEMSLDQLSYYLVPWLEKALQSRPESCPLNVLRSDVSRKFKTEQADEILKHGEILAILNQVKAVPYSIQWLCLLSCLDAHIPEVLCGADPKFHVSQPLIRGMSLDSFLTSLPNFRLIRRSIFRNRDVLVHESVQEIMRRLLDGTLHDRDGILEVLTIEERSSVYWVKKAIEFVDTAYPAPSDCNLDECEVLNSNAQRCIGFGRDHQVMTICFANLLHSMAVYSFERSDYDKATGLLQEARQMQEKLYGVGHVNTVSVINRLGMISTKIKRYDHALEYFEHCQRIMEKGFSDDINYTEIIDNIGIVYVATRRYDAAIQRFEEAKSIRLKSLGPNHPKLSDSENNLGDVYFKMGEFKIAISHFNEALRICQSNFKRGHPATVKVLENLADTYQTIGNYSPALTLYQSALAIKQQIFGMDRVETADTMHNMGVTFQCMSNYDQAMDLFCKALAIYETIPRDPMRIANALKNIATTNSLRDNFKDAIKCFERALEIEVREFGLESLNAADTLNKIGSAYGRIGKFNESISNCQSALDITKRLRGPWHLDVAITHYNIGTTRMLQGHFKAATADLAKSHKIYAAVLGEGHFKSRRAKELLESIASMKDEEDNSRRRTPLRTMSPRKGSK